jgi:hypothetical protein
MRPSFRAALLASGLLAALGAQVPPMPPAAAFHAQPGADVEVLSWIDRYVLREDGSVVHERHLRKKLNTYAAINRFEGETRVAWDPSRETFEVLENRTLLPSGRVVEAPANAVVDDLPAAAHGNPLWSHLRRKIMAHTGLEPGCVVQVAWRRTSKPGAEGGLDLAEPLTCEWPVRERRVEVDLPAGTDLASTGPLKVKDSDGRRVCVFEGSGLAALPAEAGAPAREDLDRWVTVRAGARMDARTALARRYARAGDAPRGALALARKAAEGEPDPERRLLAVLTALADALNVDPALRASLTDWGIHPLEDVWSAGWASPLEMACLQARVLSVLGFQAWPALLRAHLGEESNPGFSLHDRAAVRVRMADGRDRLYDPKDPLGERPLEASLGRAHVVAPDPALPDRIPEVPWTRRASLVATVDAKGGLKGTLAFEGSALAAPHAPLLKDPQRLADRVAGGLLEGAKVKEVRATRLDRDAAGFSALVEGTLPERNALGLVSLRWAGVPGGVTDDLPPVPASGRSAPFALAGPGTEILEIRLTLPKGWRTAALPVPCRVTNGLGEVRVESVSGSPDGETTVTLLRRITVPSSAAAADAAAVRDLVRAWSSPASQELVLRPD